MADTDPLIKATRKLAEDALYTAQTCYEVIHAERRRPIFWIAIPAGIAALAGGLAGAGLPAAFGIVSAVFGAIAATAASIPSATPIVQVGEAASKLTQLRHELSHFEEIYFATLSPEQRLVRFAELEKQYYASVHGLVTTNRAFKRARKRIHAGRFLPDEPVPGSRPGEEQSLALGRKNE